MAIKGFDSLQSLSEWYDGEVFQDISSDQLYVYDRRHNRWLHYKWSSGRREIMYVQQVNGDLPLVTQVYPQF
jgi:hypothetical protein